MSKPKCWRCLDEGRVFKAGGIIYPASWRGQKWYRSWKRFLELFKRTERCSRCGLNE